MKRSILLRWPAIFLLVFSFHGCEIEPGDNFHFTPLSITEAELPDEFVLNQVYDIPVTLLIPDGCTEFAGFDSLIEIGNTRTVVAFGSVNNDQPCTQAIEMVEHSFQISILDNETYVFRFFRGESESGEAEYLEYSIPVVSESSVP